jgi:CheY-like chemotaxis protein
MKVWTHLNTSTPQHLNTSTPQHLNTSFLLMALLWVTLLLVRVASHHDSNDHSWIASHQMTSMKYYLDKWWRWPMQKAILQPGFDSRDKSCVCLIHIRSTVRWGVLWGRCKHLQVHSDYFWTQIQCQEDTRLWSLPITDWNAPFSSNILMRSMVRCINPVDLGKREEVSSKTWPLTLLKILIAEDNVINQKVLSQMLRRLGVNDCLIVHHVLTRFDVATASLPHWRMDVPRGWSSACCASKKITVDSC